MRDSMKWESSLRGRQIDKSIDEQGLKELILHHNFLGNQFIISLCSKLKNDSYLKVLDLRYNKFKGS
jgi:hypothetical protein